MKTFALIGLACAAAMNLATAVPQPAGALHPEAPDQTGHAKPEITTLGASVDGHTTYRLEAKLASTSRDIYAIYGDKEMLMALPPAFQTDAPFGVDIGGVDAEIVAIKGEAAYDSWLTIGQTDGGGASEGLIASTGIDFGGWTEDAALSVGDGAVFWMDPNTAPTAKRLVLAQLTIPSGTDWTATIAAQGHTVLGSVLRDGTVIHGSWDQALVFEHKCPHAAPAPVTDTLPTAEGAAKPCSQLQLAVLRRCADDCAACDASKVAVVLGGCALPVGSSAAEVPCAGFAAAFAPALPPAVSPPAAPEAEDPWLEEALAGQHGGMLKWMLSFVATH